MEFVGHGGDDVGRTLLGMRPHKHDVAVRRIHADRLHPRCDDVVMFVELVDVLDVEDDEDKAARGEEEAVAALIHALPAKVIHLQRLRPHLPHSLDLLVRHRQRPQI